MSTRAWPAWARASEVLDLVRLAVPIAVTRMSMMLMGLTDAIVLGQNAPEELPFVLNSWLPMGIALGFGMGILLGTQVLTSEMIGRGEGRDTGRIFRRGLVHALVLGIGLTLVIHPLAGPLFRMLFVDLAPDAGESGAEVAAETARVTRIMAIGLIGFMLSTVASMYLEALRRPLLVTAVSYGAVLLNLVVDLALVAGWWGLPQMGAEGVAWATTSTRWAMTVVLLVVIALLTPGLRPAPQGPADEGRRQLSVGTGTAISNVAEWGGFNFTYVIATWVSLFANVVYGYATQAMGFVFMLYLGVGTATSVRVAEAFGRRDPEGVREAGRLGVVATILVGVLAGLVLYLFRGPIAGLLVDAEAVMDGLPIAPALASLLVIVAVATVFDGLQATASMALRAQEIVWWPSAIHIGSFFAVMLPVGYWLGLIEGRGAQGMVEAALVGVVVAAVLQVGLLEWKTARREPPHAVSEAR